VRAHPRRAADMTRHIPACVRVMLADPQRRRQQDCSRALWRAILDEVDSRPPSTPRLMRDAQINQVYVAFRSEPVSGKLVTI